MTLGLGESFLREVGKKVEETAYANTYLLALAKQYGNLVRTADYKSDYSEWVFSHTDPGMLSFDAMENASEIGTGLDEKAAHILGLWGKMNLSPAQVANMASSAIGVNITPSELIASQLGNQLKTLESMLACGDAARYLDAADPNKKASTTSVKKGLLFNSAIQTLTNADGTNNTLSTFGDYVKCFSLIEKTMRDGGVDVTDVHVFMNSSTLNALQTQISTNVLEWNLVKSAWPTWKFYANNHFLATDLTANNYIWAIAPKDALGQPTFKVIESVPFQAIPVGGGTLQGNGMYQWFIGGKYGTIIKNGYGIVKTAALTI